MRLCLEEGLLTGLSLAPFAAPSPPPPLPSRGGAVNDVQMRILGMDLFLLCCDVYDGLSCKVGKQPRLAEVERGPHRLLHSA